MQAVDTRLRKMPPESMDLNTMQMPYMYIHEQFGYSVQSIYRRFMTQSDADLGTYPDTFPNNIQQHFWIQPGQASLKPWISLGQLTSGLYFYYTAFSTNEDGRFYVNTIKEEVPVPKAEPVPVINPEGLSKFPFPYSSLISAEQTVPGLNDISKMPIRPIIQTTPVSSITVLKSINPVITGHMNLWLSCRFSDIIEYSMDSVTYEKYMAETVLIE